MAGGGRGWRRAVLTDIPVAVVVPGKGCADCCCCWGPRSARLAGRGLILLVAKQPE